MAVLRKLVSEAPQHLAPGGWLAFEVGAGQGELVIKQLRAASTYREVTGICDADGIVRVVTAKI
jgi:release factor glutamine methyltransferase